MKLADISVGLIDCIGGTGRRLTKSDRLIIMAKEAGYAADESGDIFTPAGRKISGGVSRSGHINFVPTVVPKGQRSSVLAHRFITYYFVGDELFNHQVVRHLNDVPNDNRWVNLALGSFKDNRGDIPKEKLRKIALVNAPALVARSRKLQDCDIIRMRELRASEGVPYHKIADAYSITTMTAYRAINKQSWGNV